MDSLSETAVAAQTCRCTLHQGIHLPPWHVPGVISFVFRSSSCGTLACHTSASTRGQSCSEPLHRSMLQIAAARIAVAHVCGLREVLVKTSMGAAMFVHKNQLMF